VKCIYLEIGLTCMKSAPECYLRIGTEAEGFKGHYRLRHILIRQ